MNALMSECEAVINQFKLKEGLPAARQLSQLFEQAKVAEPKDVRVLQTKEARAGSIEVESIEGIETLDPQRHLTIVSDAL